MRTLIVTRKRVAHGGRGLMMREMYAEDGTHVATVAQDQSVRPAPVRVASGVPTTTRHG
jgi:acyl-CoA thioesterase